MSWEMVIGFEVHTELKTLTKNFCGCSTEFGAPPNSQTCPVCLGMPGTLPVLNEAAAELALKCALALQCRIPDACAFDRKNYYYPDLPKNYQISQHHRHLGRDGHFDIDLGEGRTKRIGILDIHLEEDAGKNIHPEDSDVDYTLVDLNRAGTPLLEIVSAPDMRSKDEALAFMQGMRLFLEYLEISEAKMQEGRLRFELNISVRRAGDEKLGTKVEIKNLNSVSVVLKAIDHEFERQTRALENGDELWQETRLWDEAEGITRSMRRKEGSSDYRYFPEPDLVEWHIAAERKSAVAATLPELPLARKRRFMQALGLSDYDAGLLTARRETAEYYEAALALHDNAKGLANWITSELLRALNETGGEDARVTDLKVTPAAVAELVRMIDREEITGKIGKQVVKDMLETGEMPSAIVEKKGLKPLDEGSLGPVIDEVLATNPGPVEEIKAGKMKAMGFLVGEIMKRTKGKANPAQVQPLLKSKLGI
ncbi:MAG: Asp-tRNA(Asn)/Glu-tRNA(Gln) amidotransferase subunit GatB [Candidatus Sumerlaeia bacterium]|nr:Asp-tRNA(Asn)/Glu-tRNA(Gln) amidotransferase subunit GatB [Candidatus Sumerlaeia bacterium]